MNELLSIGEASKLLGVAEKTLRDWDKTNKLPAQKTAGGHRRYDIESIRKMQGCPPGLYDEYCKADLKFVNNNLEKQNQFWIDKGFIQGNSEDDKKLSVLLTNYMNWSSRDLDDSHEEEDTETMLKMTKVMWEHLNLKDLACVQPLSAPTGFMFFVKRYSEDRVAMESEVVGAKTSQYLSVKNFRAVSLQKSYEYHARILASELDSHFIDVLLESSEVQYDLSVKPDDEFIIISPHNIDFIEKYAKEMRVHDLTLETDYKFKPWLSKIGTMRVNVEVDEKSTQMVNLDILSGTGTTAVMLDPADYSPKLNFLIGKKPTTNLEGQVFFFPYTLVINGYETIGRESSFMGRWAFTTHKTGHVRKIDATAIMNRKNIPVI